MSDGKVVPSGTKWFWLDRDWETYPPRNYAEWSAKYYAKLVAGPLTKLRTYLLTLRGEPYYWYHKQYRRVPTIDQCYEYDVVCKYEADLQFERDRKVDDAILHLLRERAQNCMVWEGMEREKCRPYFDSLAESETNFFIKYGDMSMADRARTALMKQKHRMAWERRHGPVGTGMKERKIRKDGTIYYE